MNTFAVMISISKILLAPLVGMTAFFAFWRKRQFETGVWKSVEFELPTIAVLSSEDHRSVPVWSFVQVMLRRYDHQGALLVDKRAAKYRALSIEPMADAEYFDQITTPTNLGAAYAYANNPVIAMSESVAMFPEEDCFVIPKQKLYNEVRHHLAILTMDVVQPYWEESYWPVGGRFEALKGLNAIDVVLFTFSGSVPDFKFWRDKTLVFCHPEVVVAFLELDSMNDEEVKNVYYSTDGSEFVADRDTFESLFINLLF
ncbi:hypothetical protein [Reichenbachiella agariperforans]|uniref:hypothetical protein n=1 Tax=Reichenbachiella agariperforans TaxID=156994 RepID=UPI001C08F348|nr:hypothetical protein [Reichenbachiella agariperforans]MBU2913630.1 hypothetical protein [Reichenbachiella agariperforans]